MTPSTHILVDFVGRNRQESDFLPKRASIPATEASKRGVGIYTQECFGNNAQKQYEEIVIFVIFEDMQKDIPVVL